MRATVVLPVPGLPMKAKLSTGSTRDASGIRNDAIACASRLLAILFTFSRPRSPFSRSNASDFGATGSEGSRDGPSIEIVRSRVTCRVGGAETQSASVVSTRTSKSSCTDANSSSLSRLSPAGRHCSSSSPWDDRSGFCS